MTDAEAEVRRDLAAFYRLAAHFHMTDLVYTHISASLPGTGHHFLVNRYGVLFERMQASTLVKIDLDGEVIDGTGDEERDRVNRAGFVIHSAIHRARPDVTCIIHTHTPAGIAVAAQKQGLLPISQHALRFRDAIAYHEYEGIAVDLEEQRSLIADLGPHKAMILRNHGLLVAGRTIPEAFTLIYYLEMACKIQIQALAGGSELTIPSDAALARSFAQYNRNGGNLEHFAFLWRSVLPLIEQGDPPYRL